MSTAPMPLPPGAELVSSGTPQMKLPPGAELVSQGAKPQPTTQADIDRAIPNKEGFFESALAPFGYSRDMKGPELKEVLHNLVGSMVLGPAWGAKYVPNAVQGILQNGAQHLTAGIGENVDAAKNIIAGQPVAPNLAKATVGNLHIASGLDPTQLSQNALLKMPQQIEDKNYIGAAGTATGVLSLAGLMGKGATEEATPRGDILENPPMLRRIRPRAQKEYAGALFQDVEKASPPNLNMDKVNAKVTEAKDFTMRGAPSAKPLNDLFRRVNNPKLGALTYEEARDFSSNLGKYIDSNGKRLSPAAKAQLTGLRSTIEDAITDSANSVDKGPTYTQAKTEYSQASSMQKKINTGKMWAIRATFTGMTIKVLKELGVL